MTTMPDRRLPLPQEDRLRVYRCRKCGNIIMRATLTAGCTVEIKCKCDTVTYIAVTPRDDVDVTSSVDYTA